MHPTTFSPESDDSRPQGPLLNVSAAISATLTTGPWIVYLVALSKLTQQIRGNFSETWYFQKNLMLEWYTIGFGLFLIAMTVGSAFHATLYRSYVCLICLTVSNVVFITIRITDRISQASYINTHPEDLEEYSSADARFLQLLGVYGMRPSTLPCLRALISGQILTCASSFITCILVGYAGSYQLRVANRSGSKNGPEVLEAAPSASGWTTPPKSVALSTAVFDASLNTAPALAGKLTSRQNSMIRSPVLTPGDGVPDPLSPRTTAGFANSHASPEKINPSTLIVPSAAETAPGRTTPNDASPGSLSPPSRTGSPVLRQEQQQQQKQARGTSQGMATGKPSGSSSLPQQTYASSAVPGNAGRGVEGQAVGRASSATSGGAAAAASPSLSWSSFFPSPPLSLLSAMSPVNQHHGAPVLPSGGDNAGRVPIPGDAHRLTGIRSTTTGGMKQAPLALPASLDSEMKGYDNAGQQQLASGEASSRQGHVHSKQGSPKPASTAGGIGGGEEGVVAKRGGHPPAQPLHTTASSFPTPDTSPMTAVPPVQITSGPGTDQTARLRWHPMAQSPRSSAAAGAVVIPHDASTQTLAITAPTEAVVPTRAIVSSALRIAATADAAVTVAGRQGCSSGVGTSTNRMTSVRSSFVQSSTSSTSSSSDSRQLGISRLRSIRHATAGTTASCGGESAGECLTQRRERRRSLNNDAFDGPVTAYRSVVGADSHRQQDNEGLQNEECSRAREPLSPDLNMKSGEHPYSADELPDKCPDVAAARTSHATNGMRRGFSALVHFKDHIVGKPSSLRGYKLGFSSRSISLPVSPNRQRLDPLGSPNYPDPSSSRVCFQDHAAAPASYGVSEGGQVRRSASKTECDKKRDTKCDKMAGLLLSVPFLFDRTTGPATPAWPRVLSDSGVEDRRNAGQNPALHRDPVHPRPATVTLVPSETEIEDNGDDLDLSSRPVRDPESPSLLQGPPFLPSQRQQEQQERQRQRDGERPGRGKQPPRSGAWDWGGEGSGTSSPTRRQYPHPAAPERLLGHLHVTPGGVGDSKDAPTHLPLVSPSTFRQQAKAVMADHESQSIGSSKGRRGAISGVNPSDSSYSSSVVTTGNDGESAYLGLLAQNRAVHGPATPQTHASQAGGRPAGDGFHGADGRRLPAPSDDGDPVGRSGPGYSIAINTTGETFGRLPQQMRSHHGSGERKGDVLYSPVSGSGFASMTTNAMPMCSREHSSSSFAPSDVAHLSTSARSRLETAPASPSFASGTSRVNSVHSGLGQGDSDSVMSPKNRIRTTTTDLSGEDGEAEAYGNFRSSAAAAGQAPLGDGFISNPLRSRGMREQVDDVADEEDVDDGETAGSVVEMISHVTAPIYTVSKYSLKLAQAVAGKALAAGHYLLSHPPDSLELADTSHSNGVRGGGYSECSSIYDIGSESLAKHMTTFQDLDSFSSRRDSSLRSDASVRAAAGKTEMAKTSLASGQTGSRERKGLP